MDFDDAYANSAYIPDATSFPPKWTEAAQAFREFADGQIDLSYGSSARQKLDIFYPQGTPKGLVVFVHGGYWLAFDKSYWSHLAAGPLAHGWAVAMPSYDLCPHVRITQIGQQVAAAIGCAAAKVPGPMRLSGHSAGGQLVARVAGAAMAVDWHARIEKVVPISPIADLQPLMQTKMNADLGLTQEEVACESPIHIAPPQARTTVWVGANERPVFLDQATALENAWHCQKIVAADRHHFDVIEDLWDPRSALTAEICA